MTTKTKTTKTTSKAKKAAADMKKAIGKPNVTEKAVAKATKVPHDTRKEGRLLREKKVVATKKAADNTTVDGRLHASTIESPCRIVWDLADKMVSKGATRKEVMDAAQAKGVAFYTARTQYQLWSQATREQDRRRSEVGLKK